LLTLVRKYSDLQEDGKCSLHQQSDPDRGIVWTVAKLRFMLGMYRVTRKSDVETKTRLEFIRLLINWVMDGIVAIEKTSIPGIDMYGLFAKKKFNPGDWIVTYGGEWRDKRGQFDSIQTRNLPKEYYYSLGEEGEEVEVAGKQEPRYTLSGFTHFSLGCPD
jgi:hypothetical protein